MPQNDVSFVYEDVSLPLSEAQFIDLCSRLLESHEQASLSVPYVMEWDFEDFVKSVPSFCVVSDIDAPSQGFVRIGVYNRYEVADRLELSDVAWSEGIIGRLEVKPFIIDSMIGLEPVVLDGEPEEMPFELSSASGESEIVFFMNFEGKHCSWSTRAPAAIMYSHNLERLSLAWQAALLIQAAVDLDISLTDSSDEYRYTLKGPGRQGGSFILSAELIDDSTSRAEEFWRIPSDSSLNQIAYHLYEKGGTLPLEPLIGSLH